jgi:hypothetical protein
MGSSPTTEPLVDTDDSDAPLAAVEAGDDAPGAATRANTSGSPLAAAMTVSAPATSPPRHSPAVLLIDVARMLRGRGLAVADSLAYSSDALSASAQLLRCMGIQPDHSVTRRTQPGGPVLMAAATLMRAAGIEPSTVVVWPGLPS